MTSDSWSQVKRLFDEVRGLSTEEAAEHLRSEGAADSVVKDVLRLHAAQGSVDFLNPPTSLERILEAPQFARSARGAGGEAPPARLGDYVILGMIGEGGMGSVYLARDVSLERFVALKLVRDPDSEAGLERFRREARIVARLDHPAIVPVFQAGEVDGNYFMAMGYVPGVNLGAKIREERAAARDGRLDRTRADRSRLREAALLIARIAEALEYAHQQGIVHRDVKPENILLDGAGSPHLTDFGIARVAGATRMTGEGDLLGTYRYMSPEQARAEGDVVDSRTDVFSLGVVLYELVTLERPFEGESFLEIRRAILEKEPARLRVRLPGVPRDLEIVCGKALEKRREDRYQTAGHLAAELRSFAAGGPILARPTSRLRHLTRYAAKHRVPLALVAVIVAILVTVAALDRQRRIGRLCRVDVSTAVVGARVDVRAYDPEAHAFGPVFTSDASPCELTIEPGLYWITAHDARAGFGEAITYLAERGAAADLVLALHAPDAAPDGMVRIDADVHELGRDGVAGRWVEARSVALDAFWIDADEVTNAEYREFLLANGMTDTPMCWPDPYDAALDDLPVVGITRAQAEAYAHWRGLRLPTADEWEAATRWPDGALLPWDGEAPPTLPLWSGVTPRVEGELCAACRETVREVRSHPELSTPAGLFHTASNVAEFTASIDFEMGAAVVKGADWSVEGGDWDAADTGKYPDEMRSSKIGFRCALSVNP